MAEPQVPFSLQPTEASLETDNLTRDAYDYCVFPDTSKEQLDQEGLRIYAHGSGVELTDINGKTYLDMIFGPHTGQFAGLWK